MSGTTKIAIIAAVALLLPIVLIAAALDGLASLLTANSTTDCTMAGSTAAAVAHYRPDQMTNAATIVAVGKQLNIPTKGWVVAVTAALQESGLENFDHGDRDSLGLFQQRPTQEWGSPAQIMNPTHAATQFYQHLLAVPEWQQMSINNAAQAVQHSGLPDAYAQHEHAAREIVSAVTGPTCTAITLGTGDCDHIQAPNTAALAAINYACGQRGLPYVWGGNGPAAGDAGFDCSGLTHSAYAAAGVSLPRTAQTQYDAGPRVSASQPLLPGDLVFYGTPSNVHHVGIYIGDGLMIDAPDFGQRVKAEPYAATDYLGATRPADKPVRSELLESRLSEALGQGVWSQTGLGAPVDSDMFHRRIGHLEHEVADLRQNLADPKTTSTPPARRTAN